MQILHQSSPHFPLNGEIAWQMPHAYLPQLQRLDGENIAQALDVERQHLAFQRIEEGTAELEDYESVENGWHLPPLWQMQYNRQIYR